jgi:hypothetical protein
MVILAFLLAEFVGAHESVEPSTGPLLATNRSMLSVCVDGARGLNATQANANGVATALDDALDSFADVPEEFQRREVVLSCPGAPPGLNDTTGSVAGVIAGGFRVEEPGPHRLFVFILPPDALGIPYYIGNAEYVLEGDVGRPASTALYITPETSAEQLREGLLWALSLEAPDRPLPPDEQRARDCELGTPAPWCAEYEN